MTLEAIKADPRLAEMVLVKNSRLSVQPVREEEWTIYLRRGRLRGLKRNEIGGALPSKAPPTH